jgi:hypothetical protein
MRPAAIWSIIDAGFFGVLSESYAMDQEYMNDGYRERRDTMSDIEKRLACEQLSE